MIAVSTDPRADEVCSTSLILSLDKTKELTQCSKIQNSDSEAELPGFESLSCCLLALQSWARHLILK